MEKKTKPLEKCSHRWAFSSVSEGQNFVARTCVYCGIHQEAKIRWMTKYKGHKRNG